MTKFARLSDAELVERQKLVAKHGNASKAASAYAPTPATLAEAQERYGSLTKAAKALGIPYTTLRRRMGTEKPQKPHDPSRPLSADELRAWLDYDLETGKMTWREARGKRKAGAPAGCVGAWGYVVIRINNKLYRRNRLAWLYVTGDWPDHEVDHKNGERSDDRWANLRLASRQENSCNTRARSRNSSSRGVYYDSGPGRRKRWSAKIGVGRKQVHLGRFKTEGEARAAYIAAARKHHGEFARVE